MTPIARFGCFLIGALGAIVLLSARSAKAGNWTALDYGDFTPSEARRAQVYLKQAMVESMTRAAQGASEIRAAQMLDYGLGLALGREPSATELDAAARARVHSLFQTAISLYQKDLGANIQIGDDTAAIAQADFWIWMSRMLSMSARTSLEVASIQSGSGSDLNAPSQPSDSGLVTGTLSTNDGDLLGPDGRAYDLKGDLPVLDPRVVSAAHACADYAYTAARMKRVAALDPDANPKVTSSRMRDLQQQASGLFEAATNRGPGACGGLEFFTKVEAYAEGNIGRVSRFKLSIKPGDATDDVTPSAAPR